MAQTAAVADACPAPPDLSRRRPSRRPSHRHYRIAQMTTLLSQWWIWPTGLSRTWAAEVVAALMEAGGQLGESLHSPRGTTQFHLGC